MTISSKTSTMQVRRLILAWKGTHRFGQGLTPLVGLPPFWDSIPNIYHFQPTRFPFLVAVSLKENKFGKLGTTRDKLSEPKQTSISPEIISVLNIGLEHIGFKIKATFYLISPQKIVKKEYILFEDTVTKRLIPGYLSHFLLYLWNFLRFFQFLYSTTFQIICMEISISRHRKILF